MNKSARASVMAGKQARAQELRSRFNILKIINFKQINNFYK